MRTEFRTSVPEFFRGGAYRTILLTGTTLSGMNAIDEISLWDSRHFFRSKDDTLGVASRMYIIKAQ